MAISGRGPPYKPGLSIRGRVIFDTLKGRPRVRPWPESKPTKDGSARQRTARAFAAANRACKVTEASWYGEHWAATRGTPLLPRDLMIAFMYGRAMTLVNEDGKTIYSMAARSDVSKSLDVLTSTKGAFLVRGDKYWEEAKTLTPEFNGVLLYRDTDTPTVNATSGYYIPWQHKLYDTHNWADINNDPTAIVIPEGVTQIIITANLALFNITGSGNMFISLHRDGDLGGAGCPVDSGQAGTTTPRRNIVSAPLPVQPGEVFKLYLGVAGDTTINVAAYGSWFAIHKYP